MAGKIAIYRLVGLFGFLLLSNLQSGFAAQTLQQKLPGGQEIDLQQCQAKGDSLVLWLPSERGISPVFEKHCRALAASGVEVWIADLHSSYFVDKNRNSLSQFPLRDIVSLIDMAIESTSKNVYILAASRGAQLALISAREWQLQNNNQQKLRGLILLNANLYEQRPSVGKDAKYLPITRASNLPVYLLDTEFSTKYLRVRELADELGKGGSQVYSQKLRGVQAGFMTREANDLDELDIKAQQNLAAMLLNAISLMERATPPSAAVASSTPTRQFSLYKRGSGAMKKMPNPSVVDDFRLKDLDGVSRSLADYRNEVVLVNFWASWCGPCIKEIPSLHRLQDKFENKPFRVISVNIGEQADKIKAFMREVPIKFPVLMDVNGVVAKQWKIYVYPSNFLIDVRGRIQYVHFGALEWDSPEHISLVKSLLEP